MWMQRWGNHGFVVGEGGGCAAVDGELGDEVAKFGHGVEFDGEVWELWCGCVVWLHRRLGLFVGVDDTKLICPWLRSR